jgi:beta-ribofuranosylaminobenzene 5'-phosphate synthase
MQKACEAVCPGKGISIKIKKSYWNHIGLGSGTQAALAAGMAIARLYDMDISLREIAIKVGRGGTSGIGIGSFEKGGFLLDGGHRMSDKKAFLPSSFSTGVRPAPLLLNYPFPDWDIVLAIPPLKGAHDLYEKDIFAKECPIPLREVEELSHIILMQMLPSILEGDLETFGRAVYRIQEVGFKRRELDLQKGARELIGLMRDAGAPGAGMSSFGPTVYAITEVEALSLEAAKRLILTTERVVDEEEIRRAPDRTVIPFFLVDAVCEVPFGSYPGNMPYLYFSDEEHLSEWLEVEVRRDGHVWRMAFARGKTAETLKKVGKAAKTGTTITFKPAPPNAGIRFVRVDLPGNPSIAADRLIRQFRRRGPSPRRFGAASARRRRGAHPSTRI